LNNSGHPTSQKTSNSNNSKVEVAENVTLKHRLDVTDTENVKVI